METSLNKDSFGDFSPQLQNRAWALLSTGYFGQIPVLWQSSTEEPPQKAIIRYTQGNNALNLFISDQLQPEGRMPYPEEDISKTDCIPWATVFIPSEDIPYLDESYERLQRQVRLKQLGIPFSERPPTIGRTIKSLLPIQQLEVERIPVFTRGDDLWLLWTTPLNFKQQIQRDQVVFHGPGLDNPVIQPFIDYNKLGEEKLMTYWRGRKMVIDTTGPRAEPTPVDQLTDTIPWYQISTPDLERFAELANMVRYPAIHALPLASPDEFAPGLRLQYSAPKEREGQEIEYRPTPQEIIQGHALTLLEHIRMAQGKTYKMHLTNHDDSEEIFIFVHQSSPSKGLPIRQSPQVWQAWQKLINSPLCVLLPVHEYQKTTAYIYEIKLGVIDLPPMPPPSSLIGGTSSQQQAHLKQIENIRKGWLNFIIELKTTMDRYNHQRLFSNPMNVALTASQIELGLRLQTIVTDPSRLPQATSVWPNGSTQSYSFQVTLRLVP